jgi:hypothetical protein
MMNKNLTQLRRVLVYLFLVAAFCACSGCEREFPMTPFPRRFTTMNLPKVPLILVVQALENCHPADSPKYSGLDGRPYQLWKVRVKVEQVIQGEIQPKNIEVLYFIDWGFGSGGWSRLTNIHQRHSEIFFLQRDGSHWRTICDG